jgi:hypothetical protein
MTETLCIGFAYDNKTRDWTARVEYLARDLQEANNWIRFNRDWMTGLAIFSQHDAHIYTWLIEGFH